MSDQHLICLGVSLDATHDEIRTAYLRRAKETHPDLGGSHEKFIEVKAAYEALVARAEAASSRARRKRPVKKRRKR
jgi:curved DNA-binding protein CbpA